MQKNFLAGLAVLTALASMAEADEAKYIVPQQQGASGAVATEAQVVQDQTLQQSAQTAEEWLKLIDVGNYGASWDAASNIFRLTIHKDEWIKAEEKLRRPLGALQGRKLIEQRIAKNPKGLPAGDYMVIYYKSSFQNRKDASELITLVLTSEGWKVLTYFLS